MKFNVRVLEYEDYATLCEWWDFWRFPAPSEYFLPSDEKDNCYTGIMIEDGEGNDCCAGFIYMTNSRVCWMEYIVSNPKIKGKPKRRKMLERLIDELSKYAKSLGYYWIFTTLKNESLINHYKSQGFIEGTKGSTEMVKRIN